MTLVRPPAHADDASARPGRLAHLGPRHQRVGRGARQRGRALDRDAARLARCRQDDGAASSTGRGAGGRGRAEGIDAVYLLGMGGSSLCAEVHARGATASPRAIPSSIVLDTTDERTITSAAARSIRRAAAVPRRQQERRHRRSRVDGAVLLGAHDAARSATRRRPTLRRHHRSGHGAADARRIARLPRDVPQSGGHRRPVLGAVAVRPRARGAHRRDRARAARRRGTTMAEGCRQENHTNAGLELGAFIGAAALAGRDKLTVVLPPSLASLGLWIEQLVAESTGKHGKGVLPVVDEPLGRPDEYGTDRAFVAIATDRDAPDAARLDALEAAGHPVLRLSTRLDGARRRVLPLGVRHRGRRRGARRQSVRRAERRRGEGEDQGAPERIAATGRLPETGRRWPSDDVSVVFSRAFTGASPAGGRARGASTRSKPRRLRGVPLVSARRRSDVEAAIGEIRARHPRAARARRARSASARATCTRPGSITRAGRTRLVAFVITGRRRDADARFRRRATRSRS